MLPDGLQFQLLGGLVRAGVRVEVDAIVVDVRIEALPSARNHALVHEDLVVVDGVLVRAAASELVLVPVTSDFFILQVE